VTTADANAIHLPKLDDKRRRKIGDQLQPALAELVDLTLIGKQFHWSIYGSAFRELHEHLDELVTSWHELADTVAERSIAIGIAVDGTARNVADASGIKPVEADAYDTDTALRELAPRVAGVAERMRTRMDRLGELDLASQDVLIAVVRELETHAWQLRASRRSN
jgi:starvation-inducible DNA-binding protein